jgi:inositol-pentakisphosphate 2-kinase
MAISLSAETSPAQWKYISEGGATTVFSYNGPHHPVLTGKVLRLRKRKLNAITISDDQPDLVVIFQQKIISRLLDPSYLPELQLVALQTDWVEAFSVHHESFRPQERRSISMIDCSRHTGVLAPDLIGRLSCAVEVKVNSHPSPRKYQMTISPKPKWGFLPNSIHLSPETKPIKTQTCRTCMHAHLKQTEGVISAMHYCPLDLFSGSKERVEIAIEGLWDSWVQSNGSINNLRIFSHGKLVLPNDVSRFISQILALRWIRA